MNCKIPTIIFMSIVSLIVGGVLGYFGGHMRGYDEAKAAARDLLGAGKYQFAGPPKDGGDKKGDNAAGKDNKSGAETKGGDSSSKKGSNGGKKGAALTLRLAMFVEKLGVLANPPKLKLDDDNRVLFLKALDGLEKVEKLDEQDVEKRLEMLQEAISGNDYALTLLGFRGNVATGNFQKDTNPFRQDNLREALSGLRKLAQEQKGSSGKGE